MNRDTGLLPAPVRTASTEMTGTEHCDGGAARAEKSEVRSGRQHPRRLVHDEFVADVAVGEDHLVDSVARG